MKTIRHLTWPTAVACAVFSAVNDRRQSAEASGLYSSEAIPHLSPLPLGKEEPIFLHC